MAPTPPLTPPGSADEDEEESLLHMQDRIANHVAPHAALLFHQSKVYLLDAGAQRGILVACLRACVGCALSQYMRSPLGYPATRVTLLIFPFSGAAWAWRLQSTQMVPCVA